MRVARRLVLSLATATLVTACSQAGAAGGSKAIGDEMTLGSPKAKVKVTEIASLSCSHCAAWNQAVFPAFKAKYIDTGKVEYALREFITEPAPYAAAGTLLARCAGRAKYFSVVEAVFRAQGEMFKTQQIRPPLLNVAKSIGMSEPQFDACVGDEKSLTALQARVDRTAQQFKVDGTPTFVVDGKVQPSGEESLAQLDAAIQPLLRK